MITLHGEIHSSKNSRRIFRTSKGVPFVAKSAASKADEDALYYQLCSQITTWKSMLSDVDFPVHIAFLFRRQTRRAFDYVNIVQGVLDAMVKAKYLPDDNANYVIPHFVPYRVEKENPGCSFWIVEKGN